MRGKYSPTVNVAYSKNQEWWEKYSHNPDPTVYTQYDPEGFDSYGYNEKGIDRAGNHENDYIMNTHGDENFKYNDANDDWGFDGVKPVFVGFMPTTVCAIGDKKCKPCEGGVAPLTDAESSVLLKDLDGWSIEKEDGKAPRIAKEFKFKNHYELMAFINALAWVSHREDHHPEVTLGYASCTVRYWTFAINGLSENDFICAAKVDKIFSV